MMKLKTLIVLSAVPLILCGQKSHYHEIILGEAWSGNSVNTVIFKHHGIVSNNEYQYTAYYEDTSNLVVVSRKMANNRIEYFTIKGSYQIYDSHNSISLGIDRDGYIHIAYNHHRSKLQYRKSLRPQEITDWSEELTMTGVKENKVSYPTFMINELDSSLHFLYRNGGSNDGQALLKHYYAHEKKWIDAENPVLSGIDMGKRTSNPYWNHPVFDATGKLHLSYVWRSTSVRKGDLSVINNIGIDYTYSIDNGKSFYTTKGFRQLMPITMVNTERVFAVPTGSNLINQSSMAVDKNGYPHIVYYANDENDVPQYMHLWYNGKAWVNNKVSNRSEPFILSGQGTLSIPISRPEVIINSSDVVFILFRGDFTENKISATALYPPDYSLEPVNTKILWPHSVGFAEPVIDRIRWQRTNILTMLIQYNSEKGGDKKHDHAQKPIYIVDFDLQKIFDRNTKKR
jgi:hypothetical protein